MTTPHLPRRQRPQLPPDHRLQLYTLVSHAIVVLVVVIAVTVLAATHSIRESDATTLYGVALGSVGTAAAQATRNRRSDPGSSTNGDDAGR